MDISLTQTLATFLGAFALWRILQTLFVKSPLANIPGPSSPSWFTGNFKQVFNIDGWEFHRELVEKYGGVARVKGLFGHDQLYVSDPLALHNILVKDQYIFEETNAFIVTNKLVFGKSLLSSLGEEHKRQRKMLNPVFSVKHMRDMLPMLYPIAHQLRDVLTHEICQGKEHIDVMGWISRAALEYIGQGGLGYSFSALEMDKPTNSYSSALKMLIPLLFRLSFFRQLLPWFVELGSPRFLGRMLDLVPFRLVREVRKVADTLETSSKTILHGKRESIEKGDEAVLTQIGNGRDVMSILLKANAEVNLPESELLGHMNTFIFTGHDTTTSAVSRTLHLLALNPAVQSKLREEVTSARMKHGDLDYDTLQALPYLDAVCRETLRAYSPVSVVDRCATKDVVLPLLWPIKAVDGKADINEILVPKGTGIIISIVGANRSKAIWGDDAEEWKPERWLEPLPESVAKAHLPGVYSQMMTFIGGGRACIGFKFSEMEMKMVLSVLIEKFIFEPGPSIFWEMNFINTPVVEGTKNGRPRLPLKVSLVQK